MEPLTFAEELAVNVFDELSGFSDCKYLKTLEELIQNLQAGVNARRKEMEESHEQLSQ